MQRPQREEFILDVRRSARTLQKSTVETDSDAIDTDVIAKILHRATHWLTPKVVEHYDPGDFTDWAKEQQTRLRLAVDEFRGIARQVPTDQPATIDQFKEGTERLRDLIDVLGKMVLEEWRTAIATVESQAEGWAVEAEWRCQRVNKKVSESLIGTYQAPQLLMFAAPNLYVLDPVARFIPGGQGSFDLAIQPSYQTTSLYRGDSGVWYVHMDVRNGVSYGNRVEWSRDTFYKCFEELRAVA
jgi:hypothetical protein